MIRFCLFGSGRMGEVYAKIIARHEDAELVAVVSTNRSTASALTSRYGGQVFKSFTDCLGLVEVDAAIIGSPTNTHLEIITELAQAGKAILCEKPIDVSLERVDECISVLEQHPTPFTVGFNRRFDPTINALRNQVMQGDVGKINMVLLTSRDPAPPPIDYIKRSGGYFCDSTIHDIDLACWITDDRPVEVFASASCLVDEEIGAVGDVDTAMTTLKMSSGALCHINNSRQAVYGFDQRIEVFGSKGMLQTQNQRDILLSQTTETVTDAQTPLKYFFLERYQRSFELEVAEFIQCVKTGVKPSVNQSDGRLALEVAQACEMSRREGHIVKL